MEFRYQYGDEVHPVRVIEQREGLIVVIGERRYAVRTQPVGENTLDLWLDGEYRRVHHAADGDRRWVALDGTSYQTTLERHRRQQRSAGEEQNTLAAEMPGQITEVAVSVGDSVSRGDLLVLMEAMKMELRVTAPRDGRVEQVLVAAGEAVERGQVLIEMGEADG